MPRIPLARAIFAVTLLSLLLLPATLRAGDGVHTSNFDRSRCTFTTSGSNPYFPLWPGYTLILEGNEESDGETVLIHLEITVTDETRVIDGVVTRVVDEIEEEDGELVELARNFIAICRETGDLWYFGEDVDNYEDGVLVNHNGAWRAGEGDNEPGVLIPGTPMLGARYFQEQAPGVAEDFGEVASLSESLTLPAGTYSSLLKVDEGSTLESGTSEKWYAPGVGLVKDDVLELVEIVQPPCKPDATTLCLQDGRFRVRVDWRRPDSSTGTGKALLPSNDAGEFWFFRADNTELIVKVLDGCGANNRYWVFASGLTNVRVDITVTDTKNGATKTYTNPLNQAFQPIQDTSAFATCP